MQVPSSGHIFILVGAGGSGKTTLIRAVLERYPEVRFMPTTTTRPPREGERNGREYFFVNDDEFERMRNDGELLEWAQIHGHLYGTSKTRIRQLLDSDRIGITSLDYQGAFAVKAAFPERSTTIFVHPLTISELRERLVNRHDTAEPDIERRLARAVEESAQAKRCDHDLLNATGKLPEALEGLLAIMESTLGREALAAARGS